MLKTLAVDECALRYDSIYYHIFTTSLSSYQKPWKDELTCPLYATKPDICLWDFGSCCFVHLYRCSCVCLWEAYLNRVVFAVEGIVLEPDLLPLVLIWSSLLQILSFYQQLLHGALFTILQTNIGFRTHHSYIVFVCLTLEMLKWSQVIKEVYHGPKLFWGMEWVWLCWGSFSFLFNIFHIFNQWKSVLIFNQ